MYKCIFSKPVTMYVCVSKYTNALIFPHPSSKYINDLKNTF